MTLPEQSSPHVQEETNQVEATMGSENGASSPATTAAVPEPASLQEPAPPEAEPESPLLEDIDDVVDGDDDDDLTIIGLDQDPEQGGGGVSWIEQNGPEMEERRRNVLLRELERVQRASFIHFFLLCLIPTSLLIIVVATVLGEEEDCSSEATTCTREERTFINAFTTRCVCDAIDVREN